MRTIEKTARGRGMRDPHGCGNLVFVASLEGVNDAQDFNSVAANGGWVRPEVGTENVGSTE